MSGLVGAKVMVTLVTLEIEAATRRQLHPRRPRRRWESCWSPPWRP